MLYVFQEAYRVDSDKLKKYNDLSNEASGLKACLVEVEVIRSECRVKKIYFGGRGCAGKTVMAKSYFDHFYVSLLLPFEFGKKRTKKKY